jgi:mercuric ion transport protein
MPVLALLAGASGIASSLSWMAPLRPYFIVLAAVTLGYAWYRPSTSQADIGCSDGTCKTEKKSFLLPEHFLS